MNCDPGLAYQDEVKIKKLGVSDDDIAAHDVVSRQVVEQMVKGVCVHQMMMPPQQERAYDAMEKAEKFLKEIISTDEDDE